MKFSVWTVLLLSIFTVVTSLGKTRVRRVVGIRKGSRFFLRMNFKDTVLNSTTIFAHTAGFKVTWEVPEGVIFKDRPIRSLSDDVEYLFDRHGFDGKSCLLNNICQATEYASQKSGAVAKILRLLLSYSNYGNDSSVLDPFDCDNHRSNCPLDFIGLNTEFG